MNTPAVVREDCWSVAFAVDGRPQPKERARVVRGHAYTPQATTIYEHLIGTAARKAMRGRAKRTEDGLRMFLVFDKRTRHRGDLDNLIKAVGDALNGIVYVDDSQVTEIRAQLNRGAGVDRTTVMVAGPEVAS